MLNLNEIIKKNHHAIYGTAKSILSISLAVILLITVGCGGKGEQITGEIFADVTPSSINLVQGESVEVIVDLRPPILEGVTIAGYDIDLPEEQAKIDISTRPCEGGEGAFKCQIWTLTARLDAIPGTHRMEIKPSRPSSTFVGLHGDDLAIRILPSEQQQGAPAAIRLFGDRRQHSSEGIWSVITRDNMSWNWGMNLNKATGVGSYNQFELESGSIIGNLTVGPWQVYAAAPMLGELEWTKIAPNGEASFGLSTDNSVYQWGTIHDRGLDIWNSYDNPRLMTSLENMGTITSIANLTNSFGNLYELWIVADSNVYREQENIDNSQPLLTQVSKIEAGGPKELLALTHSGDVWSWYHSDTATLAKVERLSNITQIAIDNSSKMALDGNGSVWTWGDNENGELGDGTTLSDTLPKRVQELSNIQSIATLGMPYSKRNTPGTAMYALDNTGQTWRWGRYHDEGTFSVPEFPRELTPVLISGLTNVMTIGSGLAITADCNTGGFVWDIQNAPASPPILLPIFGRNDSGCPSKIFVHIEGEGRITNSLFGIDCTRTSLGYSGICSSEVSDNTFMALDAIPGEGFVFALDDLWSGSALSNCAEGKTNINGAVQCIVKFLPNEEVANLTITLAGNGFGTVISDPEGINCGSDCEHAYLIDALVVLDAQANLGNKFTGWSGDNICDGGTLVRHENIFRIQEDTNCTATFETALPTKLVVLTDDGESFGNGGTIVSSDDPVTINCGEICEQEYPYGTAISLTATPDEGYQFTRWDGDRQCAVKAIENQTSLLMEDFDGAATEGEVFCKAVFSQNSELELSVDFTGSGNGTVIINDTNSTNCTENCTVNFDSGQNVILTASADAVSSNFSGWTGDAICSENADGDTTQFDITESVSCTATFDAISTTQYTLTTEIALGFGTITSDPAGIDCSDNINNCSGNFDIDSVVTLTAAPTTGNVFDSWGGVAACTANADGNSTQVTMIDNTSCSVTFVETGASQKTLTIAPYGTGAVLVTSTPSGINCGATCDADFDENQVVTLIAMPIGKTNFSAWSQPHCNGGSVTMTSDLTCTPISWAYYTLDISLNGTGSGTVTSISGNINCVTGSTNNCSDDYEDQNIFPIVTLTATPDSGSTFVGWSGPADCNDGEVTLSADLSCTATFNTAATGIEITLQNNGSGNGVITSVPAGFNCTFNGNVATPAGCETTNFAVGTNLRLIVSPNTNFGSEGWDTNGEGRICDRLIDIGTGWDACEIDVASPITVIILLEPF